LDNAAQAKAAVARVFSMTANDYDQSGVDFFSLFARRLVGHLRPQAGWHVVDVGAGRGAVVFPLTEAVRPGGTVTAVDLAEPMVTALRADLAQRGIDGVRLLVGDVENLDLDPESADAVTASMVLFFLPDLTAGLGEIHRVLRPGGHLAFTVFADADPDWSDVYEAFNMFLAPEDRLTHSRPVHPGLSDTGRILETVGAAGFLDVQCFEEVHPIRFTDVDQWHAWSWSVGLRGTWLTIPEDRRSQAREAVLREVARHAGSDGRITERFAIRIVVGRKGQTAG